MIGRPPWPRCRHTNIATPSKLEMNVVPGRRLGISAHTPPSSDRPMLAPLIDRADSVGITVIADAHIGLVLLHGVNQILEILHHGGSG